MFASLATIRFFSLARATHQHVSSKGRCPNRGVVSFTLNLDTSSSTPLSSTSHKQNPSPRGMRKSNGKYAWGTGQSENNT